MATNADEVVDDDKQVTEEDLRKVKEAGDVESLKETDEAPAIDDIEKTSEETGEGDGQTTDQTEETEEQSEKTSEESFVKQFPNIKGDTPEEYAKNLEIAYENSTAEFQRLRSEAATEPTETDESAPVDPRLLYVDQIVNQDIQKTYDSFKQQYPQLQDPIEYDKFVTETKQLSSYIMTTQQRAATAKELYPRVAAILGWNPDAVSSNDKVGTAVKDMATISKTTSNTKSVPKSKVTDQELAVAKKFWPEKSEADLRRELEVHK